MTFARWQWPRPCQAGPNYVQAVTFGGAAAPEPGPLAAALWSGLHLTLQSRRGRAAAAATMARVTLEPSESAGYCGGRGHYDPLLVTASESSITNILQALSRT